MPVVDVLALALVAGGAFFALVAAVGLIRLPDVYGRIHAVSKSETLGAILTLTAVVLVFDEPAPTIKAVFLLGFLFLTNPTAAHAVARAADDQGVEVWTVGDGDGAAGAASTDDGGERP